MSGPPSISLPTTMSALILRRSDSGLHNVVCEFIPVPSVPSGYALVRVYTASLNRRDHWMRQGMYPRLQFSSTLGADGAGQVVQTGSSHDSKWHGRMVVIEAAQRWGPRPEGHQLSSFNVLGNKPDPGTLAEYICVPISSLHIIPPHLTLITASIIPVAGVTAYRALVTQGKATKGSVVLITGIGGGVAIFALQFAVALGCDVIVTSSDTKKLQRAKELGASQGFLYTDDDWVKQVQEYLYVHQRGKAATIDVGIDVVVDGSGGKAVNEFIKMIRTGGRIVMYGATAGTCENLNLVGLFLKNASLLGSTMGTHEEFTDMMQLIANHRIVPVVDSIHPFASYMSAFERLAASSQFGKIVITLPAHQEPLPILSAAAETRGTTSPIATAIPSKL